MSLTTALGRTTLDWGTDGFIATGTSKLATTAIVRRYRKSGINEEFTEAGNDGATAFWQGLRDGEQVEMEVASDSGVTTWPVMGETVKLKGPRDTTASIFVVTADPEFSGERKAVPGVVIRAKKFFGSTIGGSAQATFPSQT